MTKAEAEKIKNAAWLYGNAMYDVGACKIDISKAGKAWRAIVALIDSIIDEPKNAKEK